MRNTGALVTDKIGFLNHYLARMNADVDRAVANARHGDRRGYFFFKGRVSRDLKKIERRLRDNRTPLPQQEADRLTADFLMGTLKYRALRLSNFRGGIRAIPQYCEPSQAATLKVSS